MRFSKMSFAALSVLVALIVWANISEGFQEVASRQTGQSPGASDGQQPNTIEGKWVVTWVSVQGEQKKRIFTFERDKNGGVIGAQDEPACPCDVVVSFKGDKLKLRVTAHKPTHAVPSLPPNTVLQPLSTIYEAKVTGDTMKGKFYVEGFPSDGRNFTGIRQGKPEPPVAN